MASNSLSSELNNYIRIKIGECKSKEEEDRYVQEDIESIKEEISKPITNEKKIWEIILRIIYAEMLGHNTEFAHFFVVNSVQHQSYKVKRVAYLAAELLLDESSQFRIMMVASIQKDIINTCLYNKVIALNALPKLLCSSNATAFTDLLVKQLSTLTPIVKKKVITSVIKLESIIPGAIEGFESVIEKALRDADPSIMIAAVPYFFTKLKTDKEPSRFKDLVDVLTKILQQIMERKLSKDYEYENHPIPWTLIKILQCLAFLGKNNKANSDKIYGILQAYMNSFYVIVSDVEMSLLYQSILTGIQLYPNEDVLKLCEDKLDLIQKSTILKNQDRLVMIIKILSRLIEVNTRYVENFQLLLLDSLDSQDETLRQLTIEVLFKTISPSNLDLIVGKINESILLSTDFKTKKNTIVKFYHLIEQKAPGVSWFLEKILLLLQHGSNYVDQSLINGTISNIKDIVSSSPEELTEIYEVFNKHLTSATPSDSTAKVNAWFLGTYCSELEQLGLPIEQISRILEEISSHFLSDENTLSFIYTAAHKVALAGGNVNWLRQQVKPIACESQFRLRDALSASKVAAYKEPSILDLEFSFLEDFVQKIVQKTGKIYDPNARQTFRAAVPTQEAPLQTSYTKEQLERNMKKVGSNQEEVVFVGKSRWGPSAQIEEKKVDSKTFNPRPISSPKNIRKEDKELDKELQMGGTFLEQKKPKRNKLLDEKQKIAASLFGKADDVVLNFKDSTQRFFKQEKKNSASEFDFLGGETKKPEKPTIQLKPLLISLDAYEGRWEKYSESEHELTTYINSDFEGCQNKLRSIGFNLVSVMKSEFVSAAVDDNGREILLFLEFQKKGKQEILMRGEKALANEVKKLLT